MQYSLSWRSSFMRGAHSQSKHGQACATVSSPRTIPSRTTCGVLDPSGGRNIQARRLHNRRLRASMWLSGANVHDLLKPLKHSKIKETLIRWARWGSVGCGQGSPTQRRSLPRNHRTDTVRPPGNASVLALLLCGCVTDDQRVCRAAEKDYRFSERSLATREAHGPRLSQQRRRHPCEDFLI